MRIALHTFGCKANQYDSAVVRQALEAAGATVVDGGTDADAAVVNSCTVTHVSEAKMRGLVRRLARRNPGIRTVVIGCAPALDDGTIASLPGIWRLVPGADPTVVLDSLGLAAPELPAALRSFHGNARAWLKIQDGCDEHCTFCATTIARGASRSRAVEAIVSEAAAFAERHAEIVLTGVHIGAYGADRGDGTTLGSLLERLIAGVPRVRFRLSSVEATEVDDRVVALMAEAPDRLAPHLHAPLQSGSDRVLRRMGRHWYTAASYRARIEQLARRLPYFGLGADVMVGFPGETDGDHAQTVALVAALPFTYLHVFPYSERPGAAAARLGPRVDPTVVAHRSAELRELARRKGESHRRWRAGGAADAVVIRRAAGRGEAVTEDYLTVRFTSDRPTPRRFAGRLVLALDGSLQVTPAQASS